MTDLQVKFQTLQETKRANLAQEDLKRRELGAKEREVSTKEVGTAADVSLKSQQTQYYLAQLPKLEAEIKEIEANTALTRQQKEESKARVIQGYINAGANAVKAVSAAFSAFSPIGAKGVDVGAAFTKNYPLIAAI